MRHKFDSDLKHHLQSILNQSQLGDWFVLYQLRLVQLTTNVQTRLALFSIYSKNCNPYFYRQFIRELSRELKAKPKQSLKGGAKGRVSSLLSRLSAATNTGRPQITAQNTFDSMDSQISQRPVSQPQALGSQARLSTLVERSGSDQDKDSDSDTPSV